MSDIIRSQDYNNIDIYVELNPRYGVGLTEKTGELRPELIKSDKKKTKLKIIVTPDGKPLYPHNLYLHAQLKKGADNTNTAAQALLAFERYLNLIDKSYRDVTEYQEESPAWLFADWLLDTLTILDPETGEVQDNGGYSLSTAKTYIGVVIDFYKWLHRENVLQIDDHHKPFEFIWVRVNRGGMSQHNMLAHIGGKRAIDVQTTSLMKRFPKVQSTPSHMKLKPMVAEDKVLLLEELDRYTGMGEVKVLMLRFALETGVRMEELVTIPEQKVSHPGDVDRPVKFTIGPSNGCYTKLDKQRNIEIPYDLMLEIHEYKMSQNRKALLLKLMIKVDRFGNQVEDEKGIAHGRLFVGNRGTAFNKNTIQTFFSQVRKQIQGLKPSWYYRLHDLRSTFATDWLGIEAIERTVVFDFLLSELSMLMGHESTATTQKYVDFVNAKTVRIEHSARKNQAAKQAMD